MEKKIQARTEYVSIRVTPAEKLRLLKAARRPKYKGSVSDMLRDALAGTINDNRASTLHGEGAIVTN